MTQASISCIIPVFNGERYLGETLDSALAQTYGPPEVIVVDDGSTDGTADVVAAFGERVRYLPQPHAGPWAARNVGLDAARGELVAFLDADDLWHPEKLERQMARFEARPELGACVTHIQNFWIPELQEEAAQFAGSRIARPMAGYVTPTLVARRAAFDRVGPFSTALRFAADTDWFMRAEEQGVVVELLPDVLVYRRMHHTNRSRLNAAASREEYLQLLKARLDRRRAGGATG